VIHVVAERRLRRLAVYGPDGHLWLLADASGETRGAGSRPPYGPGYPIAPGHYRLLGQVEHDPPTAEDGPGAIDVGDLDPATLRRLIDAGRARTRDGSIEVASLAGRAGGLAQYGRSGVVIRGGGPLLENLTPPEDPRAPYQRLTRGDGGLRLHNADLARLLMVLKPAFAEATTVVFTVLGDPPRSFAWSSR
jgi:hypothetical protein